MVQVEGKKLDFAWALILSQKNLTLHVDESQYIDGLVHSSDAQDLELAKNHSVTQ